MPSTPLYLRNVQTDSRGDYTCFRALPPLSSPLFVISPEPLIISDICKLFCSPNYRPRTRTDRRGSTAAVTGEGARGARRWQGAHFLAQLGIHNETKDGGKGAAPAVDGVQDSPRYVAPLSLAPQTVRQTERKLRDRRKHASPSPGAKRVSPHASPDAAFQTSNSRGEVRERAASGQRSNNLNPLGRSRRERPL